jgi:predicted nucleic-acid-binding protein
MTIKIIDTNIVLRCLLNDNQELAAKAHEIVKTNIVEIPVEVMSEVVHVLSKVYGVGRKEIKSEIIRFIDSAVCAVPHRKAVLKGLELYAEDNLDFVDCMLIGYKCAEGRDVCTFDKKMNKVLERSNKE